MGNDIYQWDRGLVHHCPFCFTPLNTPQTRSRCLGEHVEWCKQYHNQLFKKGTSSQCAPCRISDEEHIKRHREIAEKIHELNQLRHEQDPIFPLSPRSINAFSSPGMDSPLTKKERKAAKKAEKISKMAKVISSADIESVARVLHPEDPEDDLEIERQLVDDLDIQLNKFFHKGTSNTTEMRRAFVKKRKTGRKEEPHVDPEDLDGLLQLLDVSPATSRSTAGERTIIVELRKKIEGDLVKVQHEKELMMDRKAGFWRWASKKAYKRLVQHGKIWSDRDGDYSSSKKDDTTTTTSSSDAVGGAELESADPDTENVDPGEWRTKATKTYNLGTATSKPLTPRKFESANDGWITVGRPAKAKKPTGNLKLVHNKGLAKMVNSSSPVSPAFYSSILGRDSEV